MPEIVTVSANGDELAQLAQRAARASRPGARPGARTVVGVAGAPGAGKSTFAAALVGLIGEAGAGAVNVPMDGFHLSDVELERIGLRERKGAPETFDAHGYAALLSRIRRRPPHVVYAPGFERDLEQPIAGSLPVGPEPMVVITEGNYLLLDRPGWREVRACLDQVWFVRTDERVRLHRLVERHVRFGKLPEAAEEWVRLVDEPNAHLIEASRNRADLVVDLSRWGG